MEILHTFATYYKKVKQNRLKKTRNKKMLATKLCFLLANHANMKFQKLMPENCLGDCD